MPDNPDAQAQLFAALERQDALLEKLAEGLRTLQQEFLQLRAATNNQYQLDRARHFQAIAAADGRHADPLSLTRAYGQVYSQNGEDGMIAEIFRRIGTRNRFFVEVGIEEGMQCNTRLLLESGWSGIWVEGNPAAAADARHSFARFIEAGRLRIINQLIQPEGLEAALDEAGVPAEIDFVSLDIDQNTHHLWRGLRRRARVVCIEYNSSIPPSLPLEVPFDPAQGWDGTNWFGAGLKAMELIGAARGMALVGCDGLGVNAFFVETSEAYGRFRAPFTAEVHYQLPAYAMTSYAGHRPSKEARDWDSANPAG